MQVTPLPLDGALLITPRIFADDRGFFVETFSAQRYRDAGISEAFVQDNLSFSRRGVLRGLHGDARMSKLVQVLAGEAYDVIVDLRPESTTYLRWHAVRLDARDRAQLYVPRGFLHGFLALTGEVLFAYKQSALYDPAYEIGVAWNDPDLAIPWPLDGPPILSPKDAANPPLRAVVTNLASRR